MWGVVLLGVALLSGMFKYYMRVSFIGLSRELESQMRSRMYDRLMEQSSVFYHRHRVGELMSRLTNDIGAFRDIIGPGIMFPLSSITLLLPALYVMFTISKYLTLISLIPILFVPVLLFFVERRLYAYSHRVQKSLADMSTFAQEHYSSIRVLKSFNMEKDSLEHFKTLCQQFYQSNLKLVTLENLIFPFLNLITKVTTALLVVVAAGIILLAWGVLDAADFVAFMWIQSFIYVPIMMLGWVIPLYERGRAAYARLYDVYQEPIDIVVKENVVDHVPEHADITLKNLSFYYPEADKPALEDISLTIKSGTIVGITGPIGSGKTTLFKLLCREYDAKPGMVQLGGIDIQDYTIDALREAIGTVEQAPFLFSKTIGENVGLGNIEATQAELESVAKQADLHDTVIGFPEEYRTMVGERGVTLSGGQKQRIAIARAFLVKRSIFLLDDIFSAVDFETEKRIFESIVNNFSGKTILIVTHRISVLEKLDRIIYMTKGKVIEDGSPEELIKLNGRYQALREVQRVNIGDHV
jgi:ATP-binding cassette subfamily B protein